MVELTRTVTAHFDDLCSHVARSLRLPNHPHYERLAPERLAGSVRALVNAFVTSLEATDALFVEHVEHIALERAAAGFLLHEIQDALTALEARLWELVVEHIDRAEQIDALSRVSMTVGRAKDALARAFLEHMQQAESELARLQRGIEALARGTVSGHLSDSD